MITPADLAFNKQKALEEKQRLEKLAELEKEQKRLEYLEWAKQKALEIINDPSNLEKLIVHAANEDCCGLELSGSYRGHSYGLYRGEYNFSSKKGYIQKSFYYDPKFILPFEVEEGIEATKLLLDYLVEQGYKVETDSRRIEESSYGYDGEIHSTGEYYTEYLIRLFWE